MIYFVPDEIYRELVSVATSNLERNRTKKKEKLATLHASTATRYVYFKCMDELYDFTFLYIDTIQIGRASCRERV